MAVMAEPSGAHPVLACVQRVTEELAGITEVPVEYLATTEKADALLAVTAVTAQLDALRLRLLAAADDVAARPVLATPVPGWLTRLAASAATSSATCASANRSPPAGIGSATVSPAGR